MDKKSLVTFLITTRGNLQAKSKFPYPNIPRISEYENYAKILFPYSSMEILIFMSGLFKLQSLTPVAHRKKGVARGATRLLVLSWA